MMAGLEDLAGATFADALEQHARALNEIGAAAEQNLIALVRSMPAPFEQIFSQATHVGKPIAYVPCHLRPLCRSERVSRASAKAGRAAVFIGPFGGRQL
jgi:hypothetical protein